jgi:hypothetical protein
MRRRLVKPRTEKTEESLIQMHSSSLEGVMLSVNRDRDGGSSGGIIRLLEHKLLFVIYYIT